MHNEQAVQAVYSSSEGCQQSGERKQQQESTRKMKDKEEGNWKNKRKAVGGYSIADTWCLDGSRRSFLVSLPDIDGEKFSFNWKPASIFGDI